ncbi:sensor histidine kinase [Planktothrix paucivesiculata]|uniref:histidine kinase n=1 Tax=Planktothrix paucivesiculata PCC 9631 TaxID=671071 RepID=A0A7Z9BLN3_9CYAN|nr:ATP-binding protein [Planktothrix paucivesiculata]VXD17279.1 putative Histidine kinase [Planktothrix paucivesiculata PCC 9631]
MKRFAFSLPLRVTIPSLLLFLSSGLGLYSFITEVNATYKRQENRVVEQADFYSEKTVGLLEFILRRVNIDNKSLDGAKLVIGETGEEPNLQLSAFLDENNIVIFSNYYQLQQKPIINTSFSYLYPQIQQAKQTKVTEKVWSDNRQILKVITPVILPPKPNQLRPQVGTLLSIYDLTQTKKQAYQDALNRSLQMNAVVLIICLLVWLFFEMTLTKRVSRLVLVSQNLAQGDLSDRSRLEGSDELAQISIAFDQMAEKIEQDTYSLQESQIELQQKATELEKTLTQLKQTQTQLLQSEKMSSLGQLVAGIAHEINNPVSFIFGNITYAKEYTDSLLHLISLYQTHYPQPVPEIQTEIDELDLEFITSDLQKMFNSMLTGSQRISDIVLSLRSFSRLDEADIKTIDLHENLDNTLMILKHRLKAQASRPKIKIVKNYGNIPLIHCYVGQLNQVFMNIFINAIDALETVQQNSPPQISIHTDIVTDSQPKKWVQIQISDNGSGMAETVRSRIFEPFFTTKPVGRGTGMGLAISYQIIVEKHQGQLLCTSTPGEGSTFIITLPIRNS